MVIPQEALISLSIQQKEDMPHGSLITPLKDQRGGPGSLTAFALKD